MRILGVDPGSNVTGIGLIEVDRLTPRSLSYGTLRPPAKSDLPDRLVFLYRGLRAVIEEHRPDLVAVETAFYHKSARSTLVLGQVRGVLLLCARERNCTVDEISPREIKQGVAGTGAASKSLVQRMVQTQLRLEDKPPVDASDALAAALCAWHRVKVRL